MPLSWSFCFIEGLLDFWHILTTTSVLDYPRMWKNFLYLRNYKLYRAFFFFSLGKNKQWFGGMWDGNMGIAGHWQWWQGCGWVCLGQLVCCCSPWLCSVLSGGFSTLLCEILNKGRKYFSQWILWNQWKCALITGWVSVLSVIHPVLFLWACFFPL